MNSDTTSEALLSRLLVAEGRDVKILGEVEKNRERTINQLSDRVLMGRRRQQVFSASIHHLRLGQPASAELPELIEQRRVQHISTILARAELLVRAVPTMSTYSGEEAKYDDMSILARAQGFISLEAHRDPKRAEAAAACTQRFADRAEELEKTDY